MAKKSSPIDATARGGRTYLPRGRRTASTPGAVSASDEARAKIARFHAAYVDQFELDPDENPLLLLHLDDWAQPLSLPPPPAVNLPPASPQHLWAIVG